jgi:hypothetical protein
MNKKIIKLNMVQGSIVSFVIFVLMKPIFVWPILYASMVISSLLLLLALFLQGKLARTNLALAVLLFILLAGYKALEGASAAGMVFFAFTASVILLVDESALLKSFSYLKKILATFIIFGSGLWVIHTVLGDLSLFLIGYIPESYILNELKVQAGHQYAIYPFSTRIVYSSVAEFYRFQSVFDEPGYLGTMIGLILTADRCNMRSLTNKILFFGGIASLSLAFYVIIFIYYLALLVPNPLRLLKTFFPSLLVILTLYSTDIGGELIGRLLVERVLINNGEIVGDNRSGDKLDQQFNYFLNNASLTEKILGLENPQHDGSSSIKQIFVKTGYLGFFSISFIFCLLVLFYRSRIDYSALVYILVFLLSAYQRPSIDNPEYIYLFVIGLILSGRPRSLEVAYRLTPVKFQEFERNK